VTALGDRLAPAPAVRAARDALGEERAWIVGGAIRDAALGVDVVDVDVAVASEPRRAARAIAATARGPAFELSPEFGTWRVLAPDDAWHLDISALRGEAIEADLAGRDFTANAIAVPLADTAAEPIDPHGGLDDIDRRRLRMVSAHSFDADPLRVMRAARLAAGLGFEIEAETADAARAHAGDLGRVAGERQFAELRSLLRGPDPIGGLALMDELGATAAVLPELAALRGIAQTVYHHLDAHDHTIEVLRCLIEVERDLPAYVGDKADAVEALLAAPLADEMTRGEALRLAAIVHDLGKPETRGKTPEGRVTFLGHDQVGARIAREICRRLRTSGRLAEYVSHLTLHHLRLGFLVHRRPLARRELFEYLRETDPDPVDVTLLTIADRLATRGDRTRDEAITAHLDLARDVIAEAIEWVREGPPSAPLPGDRLAAAVGIAPGPELGRLLDEIEAAVFTGEVETAEDAIAYARRLLAHESA
jgi:poly(A) polymerase